MKESLQAAGCEQVMISGSGSSLYAISSIEDILNRLRKMDILKSAQIIECRTLSGEEFRGEFRKVFLHSMN
jgi:hypothetical protein